ncbi:tetratricopeptide repeat protein [Candidatus Leptofilum sp.]|uniref:tetratricopeptide repeat protein n=1 Tax=Candidatus Leptofilum sp. TaxID=3241576 RepID=UPI003B5950E7
MSNEIKVNNIEKSEGIAIGDGARVEINKTYVLPAYRPDAVHNLPPPNPHFIGRTEQLEQIAANFANTANPLVVTQAIAGLGGVGKTQLALAYAHTHRDQYDMLWLLRASDTPTLGNELRLLGLTLKIVEQKETDAEIIRTKVLNELSSSKKRWLLLYDNVDELTPRDLRPYLPSGGRLLITSRRAAAHWQTFGQTLSLDTFTEAEATTFWQERELPDAPELADLSTELGYLPLAMEQAAAFMQVQQLPAAEYLAWFREARESLWKEEEPPTDYPKPVAATWQIGFEHARQRKGAAELLNLCCFLDPDGIPLDLIKQVARLETQEETKQVATLQEVVADERQLRLALTALRDYSLLHQAEDGTITLHRLVQTVARDRMGRERARAWVELVVDLLRKVYRYDQHDLSTWAACGDLLPHLTIATDLAEQHGCETNNTASLNNSAGFYINSRGSYAAALPFYERTLVIREKALGPDHPDTALSLNNLGSLLQNMGDLAAARLYFKRALAINEKALGPGHPDTAHSLNNLGSLLRAMGDLVAARPFLERALAINEKALGSDHPYTARTLDDLGSLLQNMGDLTIAQPLYERALAIREDVLGSSHPDTALSLNNLGSLLRAMGDLAAAQLFFKRALTITEKNLGPDHPTTARSLNNLGSLLQDMGDLAAARPFLEQAFAITEKTLGSDHINLAFSLNNLGMLAYTEGDFEQAQNYLARALAIFEKALGSDHPNSNVVRTNLAAIEANISS